MTDRTSFGRGAIVGMLVIVGAQAVHWLLTPASHPEASLVRTIAVGLQAVLGFGGAMRVTLRQRSRATAAGRDTA